MRSRLVVLVGSVALAVAACSTASDVPTTDPVTSDLDGTSTGPTTVDPTGQPPATTNPDDGVVVEPADSARLRNQLGYAFPDPPQVPAGAVDPEILADLEIVWSSFQAGVDLDAIGRIGRAGDARLSWIMSDLLRFFQIGDVHEQALAAFEHLTGASIVDDPVSVRSPWQSVTDHLIAWDLPAFDEYQDYKGRLFTMIDDRWQPFFDDTESDIDWRLVSWGGVPLDDRPLGDPNACPTGCIPALDDPAVTDVAGGSWYPDDAIVFALVVGGEARAYPRNIMEVHEMVNDTIGGRRLGIPYCTLCGSAQAYFTDAVPAQVETPVLRTSGLLSRSNKVMFDLVTFSVFDTFTGRAVSGPLRERGVVLEQTTVITTTWGEWKVAHPETTIVAEDGGIGRRYLLDPLRGRDDDGPIFPIGDVDERLDVQEQVLGVVLDDGTAVAFPVEAAVRALEDGESVSLAGVSLVLDGGGVVARGPADEPLPGHQAFWFAWSQFNPGTLLWQP